MNFGNYFFFVCLVVIAANKGSLSRHVDKKGNEKGSRHISRHHNATVVTGQRRFVGAVMTAWSAFNNIADFAGRVNNIDGIISNVKSWIGIGDEPPEPATAEQIDELKEKISDLESSIQDMKRDILSGAEWGYVLSVLGERIAQLKTLLTNEETYLTDMKSDTLSADVKKGIQSRFFREQVNGINGAKVAIIRDALTTVQNGIVDGTGSLHKPLYEAYADKVGEQQTENVFDVVVFITYIQQLQIHTYAILKSSVDFLEMTPEQKQIELAIYDNDIARVRPAQVPRIAEALNIIVDHRGTSAWGLVKVAGSSKCLYRTPHPGGGRFAAFVSVTNCPSSPGQDFMWKLDENNYLINEGASGKHSYFHYKVHPQTPTPSSRLIRIDASNKRGDHCTNGPTLCDKLTFEYATTDYKYFQIKLRAQRDCIKWQTTGNGDAKIGTCGPINSPVQDYTQVQEMTWFIWEPKKQ